MCGRYTLIIDLKSLQSRFSFSALGITHTPQYNIAPTQEVLTVVNEDGGRRGMLVRWGIIPSWAKDPSIGHRMINARAETAAEKPSFRRLLLRRRCLILADGFYEWRKRGKDRVPLRFILKTEGPFAFAGLWDLWRSPSGEWVKSVGNQQKWDSVRPERSGAGLGSRKLPERPVVLSSPLDCLGLHLLPSSYNLRPPSLEDV